MSTDTTTTEPWPVQSDPDYTVTVEETGTWLRYPGLPAFHGYVVRHHGDLIEGMHDFGTAEDAWEWADDYRDRQLAYAGTTVTRALDLRVGDQYVKCEHGKGVTVTVLRRNEPWQEPFGRPGFFRYWAQRSDTGAQGWECFGPNGIVHALPRTTEQE